MWFKTRRQEPEPEALRYTPTEEPLRGNPKEVAWGIVSRMEQRIEKHGDGYEFARMTYGLNASDGDEKATIVSEIASLMVSCGYDFDMQIKGGSTLTIQVNFT